MTELWLIGITVGIGVAAGIAFAGGLAGLRFGFASSLLGAGLVGVGAGFLVNGWTGGVGGMVGGIVGSVSAATVVRGAAPARSDDRWDGVPPARCRRRRRPARPDPRRRVHRGSRASRACRPAGTSEPGEVRRSPLAREVSPPKPLILVVIDGLTPSMFEGAIGSGETPTLAALAARWLLPARHLGLPVADSGVPLVDRDGRAQ